MRTSRFSIPHARNGSAKTGELGTADTESRILYHSTEISDVVLKKGHPAQVGQVALPIYYLLFNMIGGALSNYVTIFAVQFIRNERGLVFGRDRFTDEHCIPLAENANGTTGLKSSFRSDT